MNLQLPQIEGRALLIADLVGTAALLLVSVALAFSSSDAVVIAGLIVAATLFVGGSVAWTIGFVRAAGRSRYEELDLAGLFYLTGSAPAQARRWFMGCWYAQIAIAVAAIAVSRPPFGVMAPVWGVGLVTWWASRHGTFASRQSGSGG